MQSKLRKDNLKQVIAFLNIGKTELARKIDRSQPYTSALFDENKSFGPKIARHIEECLGLPQYFLDQGGNIQVAQFEQRLKRIPIISSVQAGMLTGVGDDCFDEWIEVTKAVPDNAFALRITGESMLPRFAEGDIVIIDPSKRPRAGSFVVATAESHCGIFETTFKQYATIGYDRNGQEVFELRPLNNLFPTLRSTDHNIQIIGTAVECRQNLY